MSDHLGAELALLEATVTAQRALLRARRPGDVVAALERTVDALGGSVVPGHIDGDEVLHLDLSLGVRDPLLPWVPPDDPARAAIQRVLPGLLEDARRQVHLLWAREDVDALALRDELTGALHADATARLAARGVPEDTLLGLGISDTGTVADVHGAARVDVLLRQLADVVRSELDVDERLGRVSGPGLVVLLPHARPERARELIERVGSRWERQRQLPVALRTSIAPIGDDADAAIAQLTQALWRVDDRERDDRPTTGTA